MALTPGPWDHACDSYGKVRHSKKACVFAAGVNTDGVEVIASVAARIANWDDARAIAAVPQMIAVLQAAHAHYRTVPDPGGAVVYAAIGAALAAALGTPEA